MDKYAELRAALDAYDDDPTSSYARDCFYGNLDSDVIRALLAERDALRGRLEAAANYIDTLGGDSKGLRAALAREDVWPHS